MLVFFGHFYSCSCSDGSIYLFQLIILFCLFYCSTVQCAYAQCVTVSKNSPLKSVLMNCLVMGLEYVMCTVHSIQLVWQFCLSVCLSLHPSVCRLSMCVSVFVVICVKTAGHIVRPCTQNGSCTALVFLTLHPYKFSISYPQQGH